MPILRRLPVFCFGRYCYKLTAPDGAFLERVWKWDHSRFNAPCRRDEWSDDGRWQIAKVRAAEAAHGFKETLHDLWLLDKKK